MIKASAARTIGSTPRCGFTPTPSPGRLLEVVFQLLAAARVAQLAQRLRLDLADPLAGDAEALPHFFKRPLMSVDQSKSQLQHAPFARRQGVQDVLHLRPEHRQ